MDYQSGHVMTLANSIIGVSVLAMPYCFKQCGVVLSILMLLISSIISRLACHFLLKSAIIARRKTFEFLAFYIFGAMGKFAIEVGIIGFLIGTCIAFFVVMGDLAPEIIAEITGTYTTNTMRTSILMALALFCVLPLGLLRNVDSLNGVSKATIGFYCCLVLKIVFEAIPHIISGDWYNRVVFWRPAGILQCLPIFSMALFCQTQLFEIYQSLQNATLDKMNNLVRVAVNICTWVYIFVGVFGYIAFSQKMFTGNILMSFSPSLMTDVIKIGFVLSVAFSFPLVIFPCRASLYSLLYKEGYSLHEGVSNYIPEGKFKGLTMFIVFISLIIGIMIPNIELVLGLVGSTIGVMICVLFPVTCFICISPKNTNERILAQLMLMVGIFVMVLGTYKNLSSLDNLEPNTVTISSFKKMDQLDVSVVKVADKIAIKNNVIEKIATTIKAIKMERVESNENVPDKIKVETRVEATSLKVVEIDGMKEVRHEPPQPIEPQEEVNEVKKVDSSEKIVPKPESILPTEIEKQIDKKVPVSVVKIDKVVEPVVNNINDSKGEPKNEEVDIEAIKKEDQEVALQEKEKVKEDDTNKVLIDTIQKQNEMQKEIVEQQKKLIEVIKSQQKNVEVNDINKFNEEKVKAVKQIESIARQAIEKISGGKDNDELVVDLEKNIQENVKQNLKEPQDVKAVVYSAIDKADVLQNDIRNKDIEKSDQAEKIVAVDTVEIKAHESIGDSVNNQNPAMNNEVVQGGDKIVNSKAKIHNSSRNEQSFNKNTSENVKSALKQPLKEPSVVIKDGNIKDAALLPASNTSSNINNTAPLFLKLGKAEVKPEDSNFKMIPLPLAVSNSVVKNANASKSRAVSVAPEKPEVPEDVKDLPPLNHDEVQAMRRDILSLSNKR